MFFNISRETIKQHFVTLGWNICNYGGDICFEKGDLITSVIRGVENSTSIAICSLANRNLTGSAIIAVYPPWLKLMGGAEVDDSGLDKWIKEVEMKYKLECL